MRITMILLALPLLGAAPPPADEAPVDPGMPVAAQSDRDCRLLTETGDKGEARFRKLGDLPPANTYAAMLRIDEKGCPEPVLYRRR